MKVWRKRIIRFSFRDNPSSPVFAHTLLAMSLLGGYLVLGLGTAGVLAYVGLRTDSTRGPWHHLLVQFCGIACAVISASTYPAWRRFVAPGSKLVRQDQPRLFERIDRIASLFGQQPPSEIYLTDDVDVGVCQEGGFMGFGAKNVICLGLPVFHFLTSIKRRESLGFGTAISLCDIFSGTDDKLCCWVICAAGRRRRSGCCRFAGARRR